MPKNESRPPYTYTYTSIYSNGPTIKTPTRRHLRQEATDIPPVLLS